MRTSYDKAFRAEAVKLAITSDKSISQTAKELGVHETTLYNWVAQARKSDVTYQTEEGVKSTAEIMDELRQVKKELARVTEEREILKKAAAFFGREEQKR